MAQPLPLSFFLLAKHLTPQKAQQHLRGILKMFHVTIINRLVLEDALDSNFNDYEDGVLYHSAFQSNVEAIITRNQKDFNKSEIPVYIPAEFLEALGILE